MYDNSSDNSFLYMTQDLEGVYSAREFVGWYNGLPEARNVGICS